jgi:hypothetical protein
MANPIPFNFPYITPQAIERYVIYEALSIINFNPNPPVVNIIDIPNNIIVQDITVENILNPIWVPGMDQRRN